jgi:glycosyltransferase involved in cell wall biosynthesis
VGVILAAGDGRPEWRECLRSLQAGAEEGEMPEVLEVAADAGAFNRAIEQLAPADVVALVAPCLLPVGWTGRLRDAARSDTNVASASALAESGTPLAIDSGAGRDQDFAALAGRVAARSRRLRPRISRAVGPCVYIRREALELVGPLDEELALGFALELDFAQRCVLSGLTHVAADDVLVRVAGSDSQGIGPSSPPAALRERYPYLAEASLADSAVLGYALGVVRDPPPRLPVTIDARSLDGAITGTSVHVLELILALARAGSLHLRLLVREERLDAATRELLAGLQHTELLDAGEVGPETAPSAIFHRPVQTFSPGDVAIALALGERFVLSQLDLIAYRNPGYFDDGPRWEDYRAASRHGLSAAERVIVFSGHTRDELLADGLLDRARVAVVPPGLDHTVLAEPLRPPAMAAPAAGAADGEYLLCLGTDFRHKNRLFALELLRELRERHGWRGVLVLAGMHVSPGSSLELELDYLACHRELAAAVLSLGRVDEREKAWLVAHASATVYPSVYEGFGLVPFESALAGVPCIFAPQASLAEVAPPGAASIIPWDPVSSAEHAHALLSDAAAREHHVRALAGRARELKWDAAAGAIVEIYREAAAAPVRDAATLSRDLVRREARLSVQHEEEVARLLGEREHARAMYDALNAEVGFSLGLIGPHGSLPEPVQRALLALSAKPALARPLFAALSWAFVAARAARHPGRALRRRGH